VIRILVALLTLASLAARADEIDEARRRWAESPHGPMLERILPPTFERRQLPEPRSRGARLALRYCVQCHNLPNPAMHDAKRWPSVLERMVVRMQGKGNLGALMTEMMANVEAPDRAEQRVLLDYLTRYAQKPLDEANVPEVLRPSGESFRMACGQCHTLPDPKRYTAAQWPAVVERMRKNMEWMNRIVGSKPDPTEPQLRIEDINGFLARHARRPAS
jgi:mono/diheme cytochrome c family protein